MIVSYTKCASFVGRSRASSCHLSLEKAGCHLSLGKARRLYSSVCYNVGLEPCGRLYPLRASVILCACVHTARDNQYPDIVVDGVFLQFMPQTAMMCHLSVDGSLVYSAGIIWLCDIYSIPAPVASRTKFELQSLLTDWDKITTNF